MYFLYFFSGLFIFLYWYMILRFIRGWKRLPLFSSDKKTNTTVTVIIPFRNEAENIPALIQCLKTQDANQKDWDIVFVDDHSEDDSGNLLKDKMKNFKRAELLSLPADKYGKKAALEYGAKNSNAELLLFTDADCRPCHTWISTVLRYYEMNKPSLISGPVIMEPGRSLFSKFQALEFMSLFGSGAASFGNDNPILTNGANLAIPKDIYLENLESINSTVASGDDIFMLLSLKKKYPGRQVFLKSMNAVVKISPMPGLADFISQRIRWTSKARYYKDTGLVFTAVLVFMINFLLLATLIIGMIKPGFLLFWGVIFLLKSVADYIFLFLVTDFTDQRSILQYFVLSQFVYFLYVGFVGITGNFSSYKWKERKVNI